MTDGGLEDMIEKTHRLRAGKEKRMTGPGSLISATRLLLPLLTVWIAAGTGARIFRRRPEHGVGRRPWALFLALTAFGFLLALDISVERWETEPQQPLLFLAFWVVQWLCFILAGRGGMKAELVGFFLTDLGLMIAALSGPVPLRTQLLGVVIGVVGFYLLRLLLRAPRLAEKLRIPAAVLCAGLLAVTLLLAEEVNGAKSWLTLFGFTFQPSETAKVFYIMALALPETRLPKKIDLILTTGFSALCVLLLVAQNDLGTAVVYFAGFLAAATLRRGGYLAGAAGILGAAGGSALVLRFGGRAAGRFETWGRAWEFVNDSGYQQTRTMAAVASGGLLGLGVGQGWLREVYAASTDMVFGVLCEEVGLLVSCAAILLLVLLSVQAVWAARSGKSPYLISCACIASMLLVIQTGLNVLGSLDVLPFTGVTFPLVSQGGTSVAVCWWILAFTGTDRLPAFRPEERDGEEAEA